MEWYYGLLNWMYAGAYKWKRPLGEAIELYRCKSDGRLLTDSMLSKGWCAGHHLTQPAYPTLFELLLIWLRLIK